MWKPVDDRKGSHSKWLSVMSPQVRLGVPDFGPESREFFLFAIQATARVDVQLLIVADQEQIVEVIKVILQEQCQRIRFFF